MGIFLRSDKYSGIQLSGAVDIAASKVAGDCVILNEPNGIAPFLVSDLSTSNTNNTISGPVGFAVTTADLVEITKGSSSFAVGSKVYIDARLSTATSSASGNSYVGRAAYPAASTDSSVYVSDFSVYKSGVVA